MLYCQPNDFYSDMRYVSDNNSSFIKKLDVSEYKVPDDIDNIDPIPYLIKMVFNEPQTSETNRIFALRTFGTYNSLKVKETDRIMQVYFATVSSGSLHISHPSTSDIIFEDGVMYYSFFDEYADEYWFTLKDIAEDGYKNPYSMNAYVRFDVNVFKPDNLMAKIPFNLLQHLV